MYRNDGGCPAEGLGSFEDVKKKLEESFPWFKWDDAATGRFGLDYVSLKFHIICKDGEVPFILALVNFNGKGNLLAYLSEACRKRGWLISLRPRFRHHQKLNNVPDNFKFTDEVKASILRLVELHGCLEPLLRRRDNLSAEIGVSAKGGVQVADRIVEYDEKPRCDGVESFDVLQALLNFSDEVATKHTDSNLQYAKPEPCYVEVLSAELVIGDTDAGLDISSAPAVGMDGLTHSVYAAQILAAAEKEAVEKYSAKSEVPESALISQYRGLVMLESIIRSLEKVIWEIGCKLDVDTAFTLKTGNKIVFFYPVLHPRYYDPDGVYVLGNELGYPAEDYEEALKLIHYPYVNIRPAVTHVKHYFHGLDKPAIVVEPMPEPKSPLTGGASALMAALREAKAKAMGITKAVGGVAD